MTSNSSVRVVLLVFTCLLLFVQAATAQKEQLIGFLSIMNSISRRTLFPLHAMVLYAKGENMGVISDEAGNLLMYTDGFKVWNRNHSVMPNGNSLVPSHSSPAMQRSVIVPKPGDANIYYIFTNDPWDEQSISGLYYSEVDIRLAGGLGDVTTSGVKLLSKTGNVISATLHSNRRDVWVMTHGQNNDKFYAVKITDQGITMPIAEQVIADEFDYNYSQIKFSTDSKKMALIYSSFSPGMNLYDFDAATGVLSREMKFNFNDMLDPRYLQGVEFSSDSKKSLRHSIPPDRAT